MVIVREYGVRFFGFEVLLLLLCDWLCDLIFFYEKNNSDGYFLELLCGFNKIIIWSFCKMFGI